MGRLKGIPTILSPELFKIIHEMGHGDEIVLGDANFPSKSCCTSGPIFIDSSGHKIPDLLDAILHFFPIDSYDPCPVLLMDLVESDKTKGVQVDIWNKYKEILAKYESGIDLFPIERFDFYERAKSSYAIVGTGETASYANIIIKKGVVSDT